MRTENRSTASSSVTTRSTISGRPSKARPTFSPTTSCVDHDYQFEERGSSLELVFSKESYYDATIRLDADHDKEISTNDGTWPMVKPFPVVLISNRTPNADLDHFNGVISYANYPIADCISIPNLATEARSGDIKFTGKYADPPFFRPARCI